MESNSMNFRRLRALLERKQQRYPIGSYPAQQYTYNYDHVLLSTYGHSAKGATAEEVIDLNALAHTHTLRVSTTGEKPTEPIYWFLGHGASHHDIPFGRENSSPDASSNVGTQPPLNAEFLLHVLLRRDENDAIIGDLIEKYGKKCARLGPRRANLWFYTEVFLTALPLMKRALVKVSGLMTLAEFVRRHIS